MASENTPQSRLNRIIRGSNLALKHLHLVTPAAVHTQLRLPVHVALDDLVNEGILGLLNATSRYGPDQRVSFTCYAKHHITGAILDSLRRRRRTPGAVKRQKKEKRVATLEPACSLGASASPEEFTESLATLMSVLREMSDCSPQESTAAVRRRFKASISQSGADHES